MSFVPATAGMVLLMGWGLAKKLYFANVTITLPMYAIMKRVRFFLYAAGLLGLVGTDVMAQTEGAEDYASKVDVFIGTRRMGHTFPGAVAPFGMVQLSPETRMEPYFSEAGTYNPATYEYCAGYQDGDSTIMGFAHTHFSGTGHSDLGDLLLMPTTGQLQLAPGQPAQSVAGYYSNFRKETEEASPGYYRVSLDKYAIDAELTASQRTGFHRYTFKEADSAHFILDLVHNIYQYEGKNVWTFLRVENDSTISGYRQTTGWARTRTVYFVLQFSRPFRQYGYQDLNPSPYRGFYRKFDQYRNFPEMAGRDLRAWFSFDVAAGEQIMVKCALSGVSTEGARRNLAAENPGWDFEGVRAATRGLWNQELSRVKVKTMTPDDETIFYTALYHTFLSPSIYQDVDGQYRGLDQNIHQAEGFTNYTVFSLWDTYRALHPWFNLVQPARNNDMIKSMLAHQSQSVHGMLPIWSHHANENWCMIGYHAASVIADAAVKGVGNFDLQKALDACVQTSKVPYFDGLDSYLARGYVAEDLSPNSVSKTLEYAYDDWCIAQLANLAGDRTTAATYAQRALSYRNVYDPSTAFMRPRLSDGSFRVQFDPLDTHGQGFIEGNAWNYGLYVPHRIPEMIGLMGGPQHFSKLLDSLFTMTLADRYIEKNEDITRDGIIGSYVHGNEPGHHIPYLYNWAAKPAKTQARVRMILRSMYANARDGLCGNDDAGQMSAWYLFSALGFYPVCPGSDRYALGSPLVEEAVIALENGRQLRIRALEQSEENIYVKEVTFNGKRIDHFELPHKMLTEGGELVFLMSASPDSKRPVYEYKNN